MQRQGPDFLAQGSSLGARRPNAANLPALTGLPPPPIAALHDKHQPYGSIQPFSQASASVNSLASVGNLLTPPNTLLGDTSPSLANPISNSAPLLPSFSQSSSYWPTNGLPAVPQYGPYHSGTTPGQWIPPRGMYSPSSIDTLLNHSRMPMGNQMSHSTYDLNRLPPFSTNGPMSAPVTLPAMIAAQQMQNLSDPYLGSTFQPSGLSPQISPPMSQEPFSSRPPLTPSYLNQPQTSATSQSPQNFGYAAMPVENLPISPPDVNDPLPSNPLSRSTSTGHVTSSESPGQYQTPTFSPFSNQALTNSLISSIQRNNQLPTLGNMANGGLGEGNLNNFSGGSMQSMYAPPQPPQKEASPPQPQPQPQHQTPTDRPFRCDSCPQSFNRNHDLKRHKRIHLAVKPYPCGHCDKSFSRKDALKRHILVKGCGKSADEFSPARDTKRESDSPPIRPDSASSMPRSDSDMSQ